MRNECSMVGGGWSDEGALVMLIYEGDGLSNDDKGKGKKRK